MRETISNGRRHRIIGALGIAQILGYGTSYYLPAILAHAAHNAVPLVLLALVADGRDPLLLADGVPAWGVAVAVAALSGGVWLIARAAAVSKPEA